MGLSASQARLLTITARKSDCEFQSMTLSHQKIALSRDMEVISQQYQNALNNTKLVYDYYGNGTSEMDLTYGLLMTPSVYNDYYPKLVTDSKNRVVLNSQYAAAARAAGIPAEGLTGTPSSDVRNAFIEALAANDVITPGKAVTIQSVPYANTIGIGSTVGATVATSEVTFDELMELLQAKTTDSLTYGCTLGQGGATNQDGTSVMDSEQLRIYQNGSFQDKVSTGTSPSSQTLSLTDLLFNKNGVDYNLSLHTRNGEKIPLMAGKYLQEKIVGTSENDERSVLNWITDQFSAVLGGTTANDLALQYAYNQVFDLFYPSDKLTDVYNSYGDKVFKSKSDIKGSCCSDKKGINDKQEALNEFAVGTKINMDRDYKENVDKQAIDTIGMTYTYDYDHSWISNWFHADKYDKSQISVNLNNIAEVFLTAFVEYQKNFDCDYNYNKGQGTGNLYDPNKDDFLFTVVTGQDVDTGDTNLEANFYDSLFNMICLNGWSENDMIEDKEYMQEMMKTGMVYISSISDDGYYYQGNYSTDTYINEVADSEAIAKAEAKYNTEKSKIQNKEDKIDIKMKNLDTEISSLTTEYDTTKQIITKAIEKSFKRYEA